MSKLPIPLPSGQVIDFFKDLATPLTKNTAPLDPCTQERFSERDTNQIKSFCQALRKKISDFESKLKPTEEPYFVLDLDFDLRLEDGNNVSLFDIIEQPHIAQLIKEQTPQLKMLCRKAEELFSVVEDSLARLIIPHQGGLILKNNIAYSITSLSSNRLYHVVKNSVNLMQSLGIIEAFSCDGKLEKETLSQEKYDDYLKITKEFFKDDQQFQLLDNLFKKRINIGTEATQQLLGVFQLVKHCVSSLIENGEYTISQKVAEQLYKRIDKIIKEQSSSTFTRNHKIITYLQEVQLFALKEIGFCFLQQGDVWSGAFIGNIAKDLAIKYNYPNWQHVFGVFHDSVMVLYLISIQKIDKAHKLLDKVLALTLNKTKHTFHVDVTAAACDRLAAHYFLTQNYDDALIFYKRQFALVSALEKTNYPYFSFPKTGSDGITNKINNIINRINKNLRLHREKIIETLQQEEYSSFIKNPRIESENIIFDLHKKEDATYISQALRKEKISSKIINKIRVQFSNPKELNIESLQEALKTAGENLSAQSLENKNTDSSSYSSIQQQLYTPVEPINTNPSNLITTTAVTEIKPRPQRQNRPPKPILKTSNNRHRTSCASEKPVEKPIEKHKIPEEISWGNLVFKSDEENCAVYPLAKDKYIPSGHWFAYFNRENFSTVSENIIASIENILKNGLFRNRGQGVKKLDKSEKGQSPYEYKIRLLGANGKGDIRVYGHIKTTRIADKAYNLVIFDHINLHAHKQHEPPKTIQYSYEDSQANNNVSIGRS